MLLLLLLVSIAFSVPKLVSPEWLKENLSKKNLVIIEFGDTQSYLVEGHIPGAVLTEKEQWRKMDPETGALVRRSVEYYEKLFRSWGINNDSEVVIYYKGNTRNEILGAVYAYWVFHLLGHKRVGILDGGWKEWIKKGYPVSYEEPEINRGNFKAKYNKELETNWKYVYENIGKIPIIDGRLPDFYFGIGKFPAAKKYGHIPCSVPFSWEWWVKRDRETEKLYIEFPYYAKEFLRNQGLKPEDEVILFCFGGTGAAFLYWVFDVSGHKNMKVYDASKREWEALNLPLNRYVWETFRDCRKFFYTN
ncbi:sulfurtransferase [Aquifex aeolicus]|uniref:Thiosulfate sulfurtransferase n=1 Tax=Aquifex aeolicus (strain VF5) TaxID=224324 RepID=O67170_AQUAE|nr:sulfurtransferase [Aquifex aeolicus]AAC07121.1 thiosulfate sulfurtransferase [Aquifex aeolicus VF5]